MSETLPVADPWFTRAEVEPGVFLLTEPHLARLWRANVFLVKGRNRDLLVDTGMGVGRLREAIADLIDKPIILFTTHNHIDHIGGHREFRDAEILVHAEEAAGLADPVAPRGLRYDDFDAITRASFRAAGFDISGLFIDAVPHVGFDPDKHRFDGVPASRIVDEGELVDLGDRHFEVLHLPGHSPGSIALWELTTGTLIAGDAIYDGVLVDTMPCSHIPTYLRTMQRLRGLPVRVVHGGHRPSFGRERMVAIIDDYVASRTGPIARTEPAAAPIRF